MTVIVDYGMGNLESVRNALAFLKKKVVISGCPKILKKARKIIFPGVGNFGQAVFELEKRGLFFCLQDKINQGTPFLGICLGMQLLFEKSSEAKGVNGLGIFKGEVLKLEQNIVPHMGWNQVIKPKPNKLKAGFSWQAGKMFSGIKDKSYFYFAHSYFCLPHLNSDIAAFTYYGGEFVSAVCQNKVWAVQFHPEKSQKTGLKFLVNFLQV